jgi:hypothetical protein
MGNGLIIFHAVEALQVGVVPPVTYGADLELEVLDDGTEMLEAASHHSAKYMCIGQVVACGSFQQKYDSQVFFS